jgi:hypothetical protein
MLKTRQKDSGYQKSLNELIAMLSEEVKEDGGAMRKTGKPLQRDVDCIDSAHGKDKGENIGKDVEFIVNQHGMITIKKGDVELTSHRLVTDRSGEINRGRIKDIAKRLKVFEVFRDDFVNFENLIDIVKAMSYQGTPESRAAGAFAHMENGTIYIDEALFNSEACDVAVMHEALHGYLTDKNIGKLVNECGIGEKIKRKAREADDASIDDRYWSYLRHYYARYYLQNPIEGEFKDSSNEKLTYEIRLNAVAGRFGIERKKISDILEGKISDEVLRYKLLKILKQDGQITENELDVIVKCAEAVSAIIAQISDDNLRGKIAEIDEALTIYLAIEKLSDHRPKFMQRLKEKLARALNNSDFVENIISELEKLNGFSEEGEALPYFTEMLNAIAEMVPDIVPELLIFYKYEHAKSLAKKVFKVKDTAGVKTEETAGVIRQYLNQKRRDIDILEKIAGITAVYMVEGGCEDIGRIIRRKPDLRQKLETTSIETVKGQFPLSLRKVKASFVKEYVFPEDPKIDKALPYVIDAGLLIGPKGELYGEMIADELRSIPLLQILVSDKNEEIVTRWLKEIGIKARLKTEEEAVKEAAYGAVWMLSPELYKEIINQIPDDKRQSHRIVKGRENPLENDLFLMINVMRILKLERNEIKQALESLYMAYYKNGGWDEDKIQDCIDKLNFTEDLILLELPPALPVMKVFMLILEIQRETIDIAT